MQRWIVIGVIAMAMMLGGGAFAFRAYKQNRPCPIWVPLQINGEISVEKQDEIARDLKQKLCDPKILAQVSKDLGLAAEWKMTSDAQGADELARRVFVRVGETKGQLGNVPSLDVGINGKLKERVLSEKIAMRLMQDVWKILGIKAPPQRKI